MALTFFLPYSQTVKHNSFCNRVQLEIRVPYVKILLFKTPEVYLLILINVFHICIHFLLSMGLRWVRDSLFSEYSLCTFPKLWQLKQDSRHSMEVNEPTTFNSHKSDIRSPYTSFQPIWGYSLLYWLGFPDFGVFSTLYRCKVSVKWNSNCFRVFKCDERE